MFVGSPLSSNPTSPTPTLSLSPQFQPDGEFPDDRDSAPSPLSPLPCWATQALCDLARAETELRRLQERQAAETGVVKRGVERAVLGARREERRLLERVEQDHRDAQQRLEQVQRDNAAAAQVSQSLLDQRLRKLAHLRNQLQRGSQRLGQNPPGSDHDQLHSNQAKQTGFCRQQQHTHMHECTLTHEALRQEQLQLMQMCFHSIHNVQRPTPMSCDTFGEES